MSANPAPYPIELAHATPASLGESPLWDAVSQSLFYVDIPERRVFRLRTETGDLRHWQLDSEPGCIALIEGGGLLVAQRNGLWRLDPETGAHTPLAAAPFDSAAQRFNDGKPDAQGRFWVGTIDDARLPYAGLYRYSGGAITRMAEGIVTSNGLAWSPDASRMYWSDTKAHEIYALSFDAQAGTIGERQLFAKFPSRVAGQPLEAYAGRPDGAAVDVAGCYWVAMFEGQRLLRLSPEGKVLSDIALPVRCPTMPAFGGADLRTLYITTARAGRSAEELVAQPWAGCVLRMRVDVPGLAPNHVKL